MDGVTESPTPASKTKVMKRKATKPVAQQEQDASITEDEVKPKKKRKTAKQKVEELVPLAERTAISSLEKPMYIGAHVSSAGGRSRRSRSVQLVGLI